MKNKNANKMFGVGLMGAINRKSPGIIKKLQAEAEEFDALVDAEEKSVRGDPEEMRRFDKEVREAMEEERADYSADEFQRQLEGELACGIRQCAEMDLCKDIEEGAITKLPRIALALERQREALTDGGESSLYLAWRLLGSGGNSMRIYPDLAAALRLTRVRAPAEHLRLPYDCFEIILPTAEGVEPWELTDSTGLTRPITSLIVEGPNAMNGASIKINFVANCDGVPACVSIALWVKNLYMHGMIDEKWIMDAAEEASGTGVRGEFKTSMGELVRFAVNTILYMNAEEADIRPSPKTQADADQAAAAEKRGKPAPSRSSRLYDVGRTVRIPGARNEGGGTGKGSKIKSKFWVRGHWRNQPCGPGRSKSILKWIKPFVKGKGKGYPVLYGRNYEVEEPEQS
jgi:hypothetical protein